MEQSYTSPTGGPPKNWLIESVLVTLFCCLPFGVVAIVNAAAVGSSYDRGDYAGAVRASEQAGKWVKYSIYGGVAQVVLAVLLFALGIGGAILSGIASS